MEALLAIPIGIYFFGWIIFSFYAWWKMTSKSDEPVVRRVKGCGYGLVWPFIVYKMVSEKQAEAAQSAERDKRHRDLLD